MVGGATTISALVPSMTPAPSSTISLGPKKTSAKEDPGRSYGRDPVATMRVSKEGDLVASYDIPVVQKSKAGGNPGNVATPTDKPNAEATDNGKSHEFPEVVAHNQPSQGEGTLDLMRHISL
ncbi:hypothetical protein ACLMJK_007259 [Lecanora helva]